MKQSKNEGKTLKPFFETILFLLSNIYNKSNEAMVGPRLFSPVVP